MAYNRSVANTPIASRATTPVPNNLPPNGAAHVGIKPLTHLSVSNEKPLLGSCIKS